MTGFVPKNANDIVEQQLSERLQALGEAFDADALTMVGTLGFGVDDAVRSMIEDLRQQGIQRERLVVFLTTTGGYIEIVKRIAETFRRHYQHVSFVIPNYAFSAGTVLAMSGDEIFMDYYSQLGPIDPQVETSAGRMVPALGYLVQWERLLAKAQDGTLTSAEASLMIYGFDQAELYQYEQARELSVTLLTEWLVKYKFKNWAVTEDRGLPVSPAMRQDRAEEIARQLNNTDRWHSHGSGIPMNILQDELKLLVDDLDDDPARSEMTKRYDTLLADYMQKLGLRGMLHSVGNFRYLF